MVKQNAENLGNFSRQTEISAFKRTEFGENIVNVGARLTVLPRYGYKLELTDISVSEDADSRLQLFFS